MRISRDIQSVSDLKQNASKLLKQVQETREPIVLTVNGKPAAILQDVETYESRLSRDDIHRSATVIRRRLADVKNGAKLLSHDEVFHKVRLHIKKRTQK